MEIARLIYDLRNAWVWFHITTFAQHVGRRMELHLEALRFGDLSLNRQHVAEAALGITQIIQSQIVAKEQLTNVVRKTTYLQLLNLNL